MDTDCIDEENEIMIINEELWLHRDKYHSTDQEDQKAIKDFTKLVLDLRANGQKSAEEIALLYKASFKNIEKLCKSHRLTFKNQQEQIITKVCKVFAKQNIDEILIAGCAIFAKLLPHEIIRLGNIMMNTGKNYHRDLIKLSMDFASAQGCTSFQDFTSFFEFTAAFVVEKKEAIEEIYNRKKDEAQNDLSYKNDNDFNKQYTDETNGILNGIQGKRDAFFYDAAVQIINVRELKELFEKLKGDVSKENQTSLPRFHSDNLATSHYFKHKEFDGKELTVVEYYKIAKELFKSSKVQIANVMSQDGRSFFIDYFDSSNGAFGVLIYRRPPINALQYTLTLYQNHALRMRSY